MKICVVCRRFPQDALGGGESLMYEIWNRAKDRYNTYLISGWERNPNLLPKGTFAIDFREKNRYIRYLHFYKKVERHLKRIKPNIIHASCLEFPKTKAKEIITVCHLGHLVGHVKGNTILAKLQRAAAKRRLKKADMLVAISKSTANDLLKLGIKKNKIRVIYPGIDLKKFKPKKIKNKRFTILYLSRISKEKGQHIAIEALMRLPKIILNKVELVLAGYVNDFNYLTELKKLSENLPIRMLTNVQEIEKLYQKADLVIFPTLMYEGFGLVAAEALACGKAVIVSDFPAIREATGDNAIVVKPGSVIALSNAIILLYQNKGLREDIAKKGREFVLKNFDLEKEFNEYIKIYESLI